MQARVHVTLKRGVLDPQGQAIGRALSGVGFSGIAGVRTGKVIEIELGDLDAAEAREQVDEMCRRLLANPVIEDYAVELVE